MRKILPLVCLALAAPGFAQTSAQLSPTAAWATHAANEYQMYPNVTYLTMGDTQLKMDIYRRRTATTPQPTHHLHAWRILGGGQQGRRHPEPAAVDGDGLERGQRRIPAGTQHAGARSGRGLLLRAALRRPASHDV